MKIDTKDVEGGIQYTEATRYLREAYDTNYKLDTGPTGVEMTECEKMTSGSLHEYWLSQFGRFNIGVRFNISFFDYIDQPRFRIQAMNRTAEREDRNELADADAASAAAAAKLLAKKKSG